MSQDKVFEYLQMLRRSGDNEFYSIRQIELAMKERGEFSNSIGRQVNKLYAWGFLDIFIDYDSQGIGWRRYFRCKKKCLTIKV